MNENKNDTQMGFDILTPVFNGDIHCDLSDELTLPDYMPAVKRVVYVEATPSSPEHYSSGGKIEIAGDVRYRMVYEGISGDGESEGVWCAELSGEYETSAESGKTLRGENAIFTATARCENTSVRVTAPRRVTFKTRVIVSARVYGEWHSELAVRGETAKDDLCVLYARALSPAVSTGKSEKMQIRESVSADDVPGDGELRVVSCFANAASLTSEATRSSVKCDGTIYACLILCREGERPFAVERSLPFSGEVELDEPPAEDAKSAGGCSHVNIKSVSASAEDAGVTIEVEFEVIAELYGAREFRYVKDAYLKNKLSSTERVAADIGVPVLCRDGNISVGTSYVLGEGEGDSRVICVLSSGCKNCEASVIGSELKVTGSVGAVVLSDDDGELVSHEAEIPFKYAVRFDGDPKNTEVLCDVTAGGFSCRRDGNKVSVDCEVCVALRAFEKTAVNTATELGVGAERKIRTVGAGITVCYPSAGETLWDVCKRYGAETQKVACDNGLRADVAEDLSDSLGGARFLII